MSNCFKPVSEIIQDLPALSSYLLNAGIYYAHLPKNEKTKVETIEEHVNLVNRYLGKLVVAHKLDSVIDRLINGISTQVNLETGNYIKVLFVNVIVFHDFGKINEHFQSEKMKNGKFFESSKNESPISSNHSALSAFIYLTKHLNEIVLEKRQNPILVTSCIYLAYSIFKHHGRSLDNDCSSTVSFDQLKAKNDWAEVRKFLSVYLEYYQFKIHPSILNLIGNDRLFNESPFIEYVNSFELYCLCRLNFSFLTASDYLATNEYINLLPIDDFGILTPERIEELYYNVSQREWIDEVQKRENYNKGTYDALEEYKLLNPKEKSGDNLNILRKEMGIELIKIIRQHSQSNLFFIEAPTGGGKTNLSVLAAVELLKIHKGQYNKVFYVFPFTTLITQTYIVVREMLGLEEEEIIELHSKAGLKTSQHEDDTYGNEKLNYINHLFVNYPFCLLSHIRFFDILKTNEKETNYLLHRLANSIVVIENYSLIIQPIGIR